MTSHQMNRRQFLGTAASAAAVVTAGSGSLSARRPSQPEKPNIVLIFSDQQHWQAQGFVNRFFDTPAQDALARESVVFQNAFCTTPQCSASRSSMLTGLYPHRTGVIGNVPSGRLGEISPLKMHTIGYHLKQTGYQTAYFGKWHLGEEPVSREGWDEYSPDREGDPATLRRALEFINNHQPETGPFALFLSFDNPHDIYQFNPEMRPESPRTLPVSWSRETFEGKPDIQLQFARENDGRLTWGHPRQAWEAYRELYRAKNRLYDDDLSQVISALKAKGLWDETVLTVTSDHGDMDTNNRLIFKGPFMYEHLVHVPLMVRVPEKYGGRADVRKSSNVVLTDLFPTLLDFAGVRMSNTDGFSLKPYLTNTGPVHSRDYVISQYYNKQMWVNPIRMLRTPKYKYNLYIRWGEELYDLKNDPDELINLASDPAYNCLRRELRGELEEWMVNNQDPFFSYHCTDMQGEKIAETT